MTLIIINHEEKGKDLALIPNHILNNVQQFVPLLPELVHSVEDVQVGAGRGVDVVADLVHADECPGPADPGAAVHQQWPAPSVVGVEQHMGQLDQGDQVAGVTSSGGRPDIISGQ